MDPIHEERLMCIEEEIVRHGEQLGQVQTGLAKLEEATEKNTQAIERMSSETSELLEMFKSFKGAFRVLEYVGKLAKPIAAILGLLAAAVAMWKGFGR